MAAMKLHAISDLHLGSTLNAEALLELDAHPDDWLIIGGDVGETVEHLHRALDFLVPRFKKLIWVPGNHDLWAIDPRDAPLRGEDKYRRLVEVCRDYSVVTPEDPFPVWPGAASNGDVRGGDIVLAPMFLLYDYSYRPEDVAETDAITWAKEGGILCTDEALLDPAPRRTRQHWCADRVQITEQKLVQATANGERPVLINHWPLRQDLLTARSIERFSLWCGTRATEDWHLRFNAEVVIYGHLHLTGTQFRDGVRFEEVSLGYPSEWDREVGINAYLRQVLPEPVVQI